MIAGIDFSTKAVDVVLLDEDSDAATWHRFGLTGFGLTGQDAFERTRDVAGLIPGPSSEFWDDVLAIGIEDPRGYGAGSLYRVQGAILACLPRTTLVHPLIPSQWRKTVGLPGNARKHEVWRYTLDKWHPLPEPITLELALPQDACDAYCIALATRTLLQHGEKAA